MTQDNRKSSADGDASGRSSTRIPVAGIGASAGGIRALQDFFDAMPAKPGLAAVVVVHLDPNHGSELPSVLAKHTGMRVIQVNKREPLATDTVYVIPPNRRLLISDNAIETAPFDEPRGQRAPIDLFFRSLAEQHGDGFAVVLSGGGSDGAIGVKAMREKGGLILVQDPSEAEHASMPRNAIAAGADFVLPVREIAAQLVELARTKAHVNVRALEEKASSDELVRRILGLLRAKTGQDFTRYKRATVLRRLARRMQVAQTDELEQYLTYLRNHAEEAQALFNDLLISVTSFFRDPDAYKALASEVMPALFEQNSGDGAIRVWVAGCATGEEAYSIAMLLLEEAGQRDVRPDIQVFATDLDEQALAVARDGRYPATIAADVSEERLRRFFVREGDQFRIRREVRDLVVFAVHSILRDPPFSRINLLTCRNLMIYLDRDLQQQVCSILHYALLPTGYLFLGTSETAESPMGLFAPLDRDARIYQALERTRDALPMLPRVLSAVRLPEPTLPRPVRPQTSVDASVHWRALEEIGPPSMLVDEGLGIVNLSETAGRFLLHPGGPIVSEASEVVRPELRLELTAALHRAFEQGQPSVTLPIPVRFNGSPTAVVLHVRPVMREGVPRTALVLFLEGGPVEAGQEPAQIGEASPIVSQLREELSATRTVLRTTREQYEAATEELRAANEELQSINEEYRSTAEELETSKEELQSINEELQTLNNELKIKLELVSRAHNDLQNLMSATDISTMFLDTSLRIQRFTPRISELFNVQAGDEGRPVTDFTHRLEYQDLVGDARRVLADLIPIERTVHTTNDRWFLIRLRPYRTLDDKIDGVVATFVDVTERRQAEAEWERRQKMLLGELSHRVKNTLAVVQAVARLTLQGVVSEGVLDAYERRLQALARSHELLVSGEWRGASLEALTRQQLAPYLAEARDRIALSGPPVILPPSIATPLGLTLHELATNAVKHGALKSPAGKVKVSWETRDLDGGVRVLELTWTERGGPKIAKPSTTGAGSDLIDHALPDAQIKREFSGKGLTCVLTIPLTGSLRAPV